MRTKLLAFVLGASLAALAAVSASACAFHMTSADNDQAQPAQTAQAQPPGQSQTE
jgi:hypothetical protein